MTDKILFYFVSVLVAISIIASYSLPAYFVYVKEISHYHFFMRTIFAGFVGLSLIWAMSSLDPDRWLNFIGFSLFFFFFLLMIIMPFMPASIVPEINGAKRWIKLPGFSLSPIEFFKVGFIYFLAWSFTRKFYLKDKKIPLLKEFNLFIPYFLVFGIVVLLVAFMQNDFGQVAVLFTTLILMSFFAGASLRIFFVLIFASFVGFIALIVMSAHRIERIKHWWIQAQDIILAFLPNSISDTLRIKDMALEPSYQISQSLHAFYNGGMSGTGLGEGIVKLGYLSDVHTDFILAGIAEEGGFIGLLFVTMIFFLVIYRIFKIANRSENHVYYLFVAGAGIMISVQFFINALGVIGLIPLKGIAVPFLSYGGSSLLSLCICIGMIIMVSKKISY